MSVCTFLALSVLPGAWLPFLPAFDSLSLTLRFALAAVLSPVALALEMCLLRACGLSFNAGVVVICIIALPAIAGVIRAVRRAPRPRLDAGALSGLLLFLLLAGCAAFPSLLQPAYRVYSRHALLHADITYATVRGGLFPEEPALAGVRLGYA